MGNGAVELYYDNVKKFETLSNGVAVAGKVDITGGHLYLDDNYAARFGTGEDLLIYHNGSSSYIDEVGTGSLKIQTNGTGVDIQKGSSETIARFIADGAVQLYHDNAQKFTTTSSGILVSGNINNSSSVNNTGDSGIQMGNGERIGFDESGTRSWTVKATGGNLEIASGDGNGNFKTVQSILSAGTVSDSIGNLRSIVGNAQNGAYTLVAADAGKMVTTSGNTLTVNQNVFANGDAVSIINNSGSDMTITQGSSMNIYNTADGSTGSRTLATRGMATLWFFSHNYAYISGAGLS